MESKERNEMQKESGIEVGMKFSDSLNPGTVLTVIQVRDNGYEEIYDATDNHGVQWTIWEEDVQKGRFQFA
jgi:hypothetical protein